MKLENLYSLQYTSEYIYEGETLSYPKQPNFPDYISRLSVVFNKSYNLITKIKIKIFDETLEETQFSEKGNIVFRLSNFTSVAYPYGTYPILKIKFEGNEIPRRYRVCYVKHKYEIFISPAIKIFAAYTRIKNSKYKYIKFIDKPYFQNDNKTRTKLVRPKPIEGKDIVAVTCNNFDTVVKNVNYEYLKKLINPPIVGCYANILSAFNIIDKDIIKRGYTILVKADFADTFIDKLSKDYYTFIFKKIIQESYDDYGISYDIVKNMVKYLYKKKFCIS